MRLFLVRHGSAEEKMGRPDAERALTAEGRSEVAAICPAIAAALEPPTRLLSSPFLRAEQTAEILRESLGIDSKIQPTDALLPESDWPALREALRALAPTGAQSFVVVGHNPSISMIAAAICAGDPNGRIGFVKGAVACLDIDDLGGRPAGELRWLVTPKALRAAKRAKD
jgi:phosphohistidine phosphatase